MAELNGITYEKWEDYIYDKFPVEEFNITENKSDTSEKEITIHAKDSFSKTKIIFDFPISNLCRVLTYNVDSPLYNMVNDIERLRALMFSDYEINSENLGSVDEYLNMPLYYGWTEKAIFYKDRLIKSEVLYFDGNSWQTIPMEQNLSWFDKAGCLISFFTWPLLYIQYLFVIHKLNENNRHVKVTKANIQPMRNKNSVSEPFLNS